MPMTHPSRAAVPVPARSVLALRSARRRAFAVLATLALAVPLLAAGCEDKMDPKQCDKYRGDAFDLLNKAQHCNTDVDCHQSDWPGCAKPISNATVDAIKPMKEAFAKGKCAEPPP